MNVHNAQAGVYSAKTAVAALLALWISLAVGLSMPFWAMTTVYIVSSPLSGATRSKGIYRVTGTAIGAGVAVALVPMLVAWPELLCLALALWVGGCLAVSLLDRSPRAYVLMLAGYTATLIAFPSVDKPEAVFDVATARVTEIVLGIACATLSHSLLWPRSVASALAPRLRGWLADAQMWRCDILADAGAVAIGRDRRKLAVDAVECALLAKHIPFDTSHWREATASVQALLRRYLLLIPVLSGLADRHGALTGGQDRWSMLLRESRDLRAAQADMLLSECGQLLAHLENPHLPAPFAVGEQSGKVTLHADPGSAMLSGLSAATAIALVCTIWIGLGWPDGGSAAAITGVICCLFAALDRPVPAMLAFGCSIVAGIPLAALYLFVILPQIDGFPLLAMVLALPLLGLGLLMSHARLALPAVGCVMGFCNAMALQESFSANFARFLNASLAQVVAVVVSAVVTAGLRTAGGNSAIVRLNRRLRANLVSMANATSPPDPLVALGRSTDQLALLSQRLGDETVEANAGLVEVRIAMNIMTLQHLRTAASEPLRSAITAMLADIARWYSHDARKAPAPRALLSSIDAALDLALFEPPCIAGKALPVLLFSPDQGRAALVALRRNLFPDAAAFQPGALT